MADANNATNNGGKTVTKIANSDAWAGVSRLANVYAAAVLTLIVVPIAVWVVSNVQNGVVILNQHSHDIDDIKVILQKIDGRTVEDHDHLGRIDGQLQLLGARIDNMASGNALQKAASDGQIADIKDSLNRLWVRVGSKQ